MLKQIANLYIYFLSKKKGHLPISQNPKLKQKKPKTYISLKYFLPGPPKQKF